MTASTAAAALPPRAAAAPAASCGDTGAYLADPALDCPACPGPRYPDEGDDE
ncbi:hypothetical protein [Embleya sp. NPDC001921]